MQRETIDEMVLYFCTGNKGKFTEAQTIFPNIKQLDVDLPEIQELDPCRVIEAKLKEAIELHEGEFFIEDTSLYVKAMKGFPGPLVKWYLEALGNEGIYKNVCNYDDHSAEAKTVIGYVDSRGIKFFEGSVKGEIVAPKGKGFGWDPIFLPKGHDKTFAQDPKYKARVSMRKEALLKLKEYLEK